MADRRILRIQFCQSGASVHVKSADKALTVELPKGIALSIYNTAADIHAETLEQKFVFVSCHSWNFDCVGLTADSIDLSSSSGNIILEQIEGDSLQLETTSGKLKLTLPENGAKLSFITVSGSLKTSLPCANVGDLRVFGDGGPPFTHEKFIQFQNFSIW